MRDFGGGAEMVLLPSVLELQLNGCMIGVAARSLARLLVLGQEEQ